MCLRHELTSWCVINNDNIINNNNCMEKYIVKQYIYNYDLSFNVFGRLIMTVSIIPIILTDYSLSYATYSVST